MKPLSRTLFMPVLASIAFPLAAQDVTGVGGDAGTEAAPVIRPGDSLVEMGANAVVPGKPVVRMQLVRYASPVVSFKPERLAAGEIGEVVIVLALQQKSVLPANAQVKLDYEKEQGPLVFGEWSLDPAKKAEVESFYKGQRVHDNYAILHIPVQIKGDTKPGRYSAGFSIEANVSAGDTGQDYGRFALTTSGNVEVGKPIPRPVVRIPTVGDDVVPASEPEAHTGPRDVAPAPVPDRAARRSEVAAATGDYGRDVGGDASSVIENGDELVVVPDDDGGFDWIILGGAIGLLVLGSILVLARKR